VCDDPCYQIKGSVLPALVYPMANPINGIIIKRMAESTFDKNVTSFARFSDNICFAEVCGIFICDIYAYIVPRSRAGMVDGC
jgi:hypothetical protein